MCYVAKMTWNYIIIQGVDPEAGVLISVLKKALFSTLIGITKEDSQSQNVTANHFLISL